MEQEAGRKNACQSQTQCEPGIRVAPPVLWMKATIRRQKHAEEQPIQSAIRRVIDGRHVLGREGKVAARRRFPERYPEKSPQDHATTKQYASDQRMLNVGYSTNDVVLEGQIALAVARIGELRAQTERNKALAELERAMGTGIEANRITIQVRKRGD